MCGIVGLFIKNPELENHLGKLLSDMLIEMTERGPDSAGVAVYHDPVETGTTKMTVLAPSEDYAWGDLHKGMVHVFDADAVVNNHRNQAVIKVAADPTLVQNWLQEQHSELRINGAGEVIEIFKDIGLPADFVKNFNLESYSGTHALGHTRMATESAVTPEHSHPFSTGKDLCLVHNGSLSNHNRLRSFLRSQGIKFETDNDSEVAAGYLTWRMHEGDSLEEAIEHAIEDLDGFYTFAIGSKDGFAVVTDPIGAKPAVMAETDDWAAMASEFRAIAQLPGVENARIWEPKPTEIYNWYRG